MSIALGRRAAEARHRRGRDGLLRMFPGGLCRQQDRGEHGADGAHAGRDQAARTKAVEEPRRCRVLDGARAKADDRTAR